MAYTVYSRARYIIKTRDCWVLGLLLVQQVDRCYELGFVEWSILLRVGEITVTDAFDPSFSWFADKPAALLRSATDFNPVPMKTGLPASHDSINAPASAQLKSIHSKCNFCAV
jgi:hypothetical protein